MYNIRIRANNQKYVCAENGGDRPLVANRDEVLSWESFTIQILEGTVPSAKLMVSIRAVNNKYVSLKPDQGNILIADADSVGVREQFELVFRIPQKFGIKASNGSFVTCDIGGDDLLIAARDSIGYWETFIISADANCPFARTENDLLAQAIFMTSGVLPIALKADNHKYVAAEDGGTRPMVANRDQIGSWEKFLVHNSMYPSAPEDQLLVGFLAHNGNYEALKPGEGDVIKADRSQGDPNQVFKLFWCSPDRVAMKAGNDRFVSYQTDGQLELKANREGIGNWEKYRLIQPEGVNLKYEKSSWMGDLKRLFDFKRLRELTLPGTHDSGTHALQMELAPDASDVIKGLWDYGSLNGATGIREYI